jgi:hypothetical protein
MDIAEPACDSAGMAASAILVMRRHIDLLRVSSSCC